ncbi:non-functional NADPH-dependent codeinone reductase 2-like [Miscanthus floridulus]|uniref:non-functional NADPH-dependent codeinone reductase 2-like n=1 Tax=Miscanthus floridulus TaxID=154761 RepID=UPI003457908C
MASTGTAAAVPEVALRSGDARPMPMVGMGTAQFPLVHEATKNAVLAAIEVGFRHFDTAFMYGTEKPLGEAAAEALRRGLLQSREELFVTSKLWCSQNHPDLVLPSLRDTLKNLQMEYVDLYLIHWPVCVNGPPRFPNKKEDAVPLDFEGVWRAMEECQRLGLAKAIGVSNFTTKHLGRVLAVATIPPAVNQVELNPAWQQRTLRAYCADRGIHVAAYSPLGGQNWDGQGNAVLDSVVLAEIAKARGKTVAQVALRWTHEQGATCIVKSYNKERLKQNLEIFDWELTEEDRLKISRIPQRRVVQATTSGLLFSEEGEFTSVDPAELNIVEE